eukprot:CAMPEP_0204353128 /NCGR_PEP_ID=MMETSP0469-20131031/32428_1 /ASSEMBLY_ACC=CAM_ASM_000384 /TAXON_ID=2969 /ORGANISM="Oxyrrhis marina" /LENGTH=122 /DNA_ID=CAMNT_0051339987 /DNA_START=45 /DNA_END=412 /DNA_ORIENTATION=-
MESLPGCARLGPGRAASTGGLQPQPSFSQLGAGPWTPLLGPDPSAGMGGSLAATGTAAMWGQSRIAAAPPVRQVPPFVRCVLGAGWPPHVGEQNTVGWGGVAFLVGAWCGLGFLAAGAILFS